MGDLKYVRMYINDLLITTKSDWQDHLHHLDIIFHWLKDAGLKLNAKKSFFGKDKLEYLGYWITRAGIQPISKKVEVIKNIASPKTKRELRRFIGIVNYYWDMWIRRSEGLAPLSKLTSKTTKWQWDASHAQLGAVISQDNKPIAFYSRKLNPAQTQYTTTEHELLSIVETLK